MVPVHSGIRTDTDLNMMKYVIFALCVCAASAASIQNDSGFYKPWQVKATAQAEVVPVVTPVESVKVIQPVQQVKTFQPVQSFQPIPPVVKNYVPLEKEAAAEVLRFTSDVKPDGYNYNYETQNGIVAEANGALKTVDNAEVLGVQGYFRYISPDGTPVEVTYTADENGFHPQSPSLPVGPEIPEYVLRAQEYIRTHPAKVEIVKKL